MTVKTSPVLLDSDLTTIRTARGTAPALPAGLDLTVLTSNILACYDAADEVERVAGGGWYPAAQDEARRLVDAYGVSLNVAAGVLAALSPRNRWSRNVADAAGMVAAFHVGGTSAAVGVKVCTFTPNKMKAIAILEAVSPTADEVAAILSGRKLRSFFGCIIGAADCCIDGHAVAIALGKRIVLSKTPSLSASRYAAYQVAYGMAAQARGISASTIQAVTWVAYRNSHGITVKA